MIYGPNKLKFWTGFGVSFCFTYYSILPRVLNLGKLGEPFSSSHSYINDLLEFVKS